MPAHQRRGRSCPANHRLCEYTPHPLKWRPAEKRAHNGLHKTFRQTVQHRHHRRANPNERRSERHQQKVLNHVHRKKLLVEGRQRRTQRQPDQKQADKKTTRPPRREYVRGHDMETPPSPQIDQRKNNGRQGESDWWRPGRERGLNRWWHDGVLRLPVFRLTFLKSRVARRKLPGRVQGPEERNERSGLRGIQIFSVGWHVAASLDDLADELILR